MQESNDAAFGRNKLWFVVDMCQRWPPRRWAALKYDILTRWRDAARLRPQQAAVVVVAVNSYFKNILLCIGTYKTFLNWPKRKI